MLKDYFRFTSSNYHFLSFGLLTAFFGNFGQTFFIAWFGNSIQQDFDLSAGEYGLLYSSATLTSGFIILYAGALLDKTDLRKVYFCGKHWVAFRMRADVFKPTDLATHHRNFSSAFLWTRVDVPYRIYFYGEIL